LGVVYLSPALRDRLSPGAVGWYSVREIFTEERFDRYEYKPGAEALVTGMPNFPGIYAMRAALKYLLEIGPARIDAGLRPLIDRLREGLKALGLDLLTPPGAEFASGIVSFAHPAAAAIGAELERRGVVVWTGDGRVRASVHLYNREADIDRYLAELASLPELHRA
jgi:selenocysteine lyase/cysteine desulfurase